MAPRSTLPSHSHQLVCARTLRRSGSCPLASGAIEYTSTDPVGSPPATYSCAAPPLLPATTIASLTSGTLNVRATAFLRTSKTVTVSLRSQTTSAWPSGAHESERFSSPTVNVCVALPFRASLLWRGRGHEREREARCGSARGVRGREEQARGCARGEKRWSRRQRADDLPLPRCAR